MNKKVTLTGLDIYSPVMDISTDYIFKFLDEITSGLEDQFNEGDENLQIIMRTTFRGNTPAIIRFRSQGGPGTETKEKITRVINQITQKYICQNQGSMEVVFDVQSIEKGVPVGGLIADPMVEGTVPLSVNMQG